ncbi:MAG: DUF4249 domain-containing protein [Cyclobacteriaceae bacterium]
MQRYIKISLLAIALISCEETTDLDLKQTPSKIVIEGLLTDQPGYQSVEISRSTGFYGSGQTPRVLDATVKVTDDAGLEFNFIHNPRNHPDSAGIYIPEVGFSGEAGRVYTLHVTVDGESYEASDKLLSVAPIDSLKFQINENEQDDPKEEGKFYELLVYAREPQDEENFYLFRYYRNDSLIFYNPSDVYYSDDELLAEKIDGVPSPVYYASNDKARLEFYSLTRNGYVFYNDLSTILNNDGGGMFGPIPSSPRTNLSNGALGFFQVSAVQEKETYIE